MQTGCSQGWYFPTLGFSLSQTLLLCDHDPHQVLVLIAAGLRLPPPHTLQLPAL